MQGRKRPPAQPVRPLTEIYEDLSTAKPGRQARKLHRELKQYGSGLGFLDRYPVHYWAALASVVISVTAVIFALLSVLVC